VPSTAEGPRGAAIKLELRGSVRPLSQCWHRSETEPPQRLESEPPRPCLSVEPNSAPDLVSVESEYGLSPSWSRCDANHSPWRRPQPRPFPGGDHRRVGRWGSPPAYRRVGGLLGVRVADHEPQAIRIGDGESLAEIVPGSPR